MAPYDLDNHRRYYLDTKFKSLQALASLHSVDSRGSKGETVARLVAQDRRTGTGPGMLYTSAMEEEGAGEEEGWELVSSKRNKTAACAEKEEDMAEEIEEVSVVAEEEPSVCETTTSTVAEMEDKKGSMCPLYEIVRDGSAFEQDNAIPMQQLVEEWDAYLTASKTTVARSQDTSGSSSKSESTGATTPAERDEQEPLSWAGEVSEAALEKVKVTLVEETPIDEEAEEVLLLEEKPAGETPSLGETEERAVQEGAQVEETASVSLTEVQANEPSKKKKKRGKQGGRKVNKSKAAQMSGENSTGAAVHDAVPTRVSEDLPAASSSVEVASIEVSPDTTEGSDAAEGDALAASAEYSDVSVSGELPDAIDDDGGIDEDLPFVDAQTNIDEPQESEAIGSHGSDATPAVVVQPVEEEQEDISKLEVAPAFPAASVLYEATMPGGEPAAINTAPRDSDTREQENNSNAVSTKKQRKRGKKGGKKAKKGKTMKIQDAPLTKVKAMQAGISAMVLALLAAVFGMWMKR